jgi:hypothetical protein
MSVSNTQANDILNLDKEARKVAALKYLWQLMPGMNNQVAHPDDNTKRLLYDKFIDDAGGHRYPDHFTGYVKSYGYPWPRLRRQAE